MAKKNRFNNNNSELNVTRDANMNSLHQVMNKAIDSELLEYSVHAGVQTTLQVFSPYAHTKTSLFFFKFHLYFDREIQEGRDIYIQWSIKTKLIEHPACSSPPSGFHHPLLQCFPPGTGQRHQDPFGGARGHVQASPEYLPESCHA